MKNTQYLRIMELIPKVVPEGTTRDQWVQWATQQVNHEDYCAKVRPKKEAFTSDEEYDSEMMEWHRKVSCDAPNKPGYYRSNND